MSCEHHDPAVRMQHILKTCWQSQPIFYGLHKRTALLKCSPMTQRFLANDWAVNLSLAAQGKLHVTEAGWIHFGTEGASNTPGYSQSYRQRWLDYVLPLSRLSGIAWRLSRGTGWRKRARMMWTLLKLNMIFLRSQLIEAIR